MPVNVDENVLKAGILQPYLSVRTKFEQDGSPLHILSAVFQVLDPDNGDAEVPVPQHHPPYLNYPDVGWVQADIDTTVLKADKQYKFRFTVEAQGVGTVQKETTVRMYAISRRQWLIDQLRTVLLDKAEYERFVPYLHQRYLIRKPWELEWQNEELNTYLELSLSDLNNAVPPTITFALETCPATAYLIRGAALHAIYARIMVEFYNWFDSNAPVQVHVNKGDKLLSAFNAAVERYRNDVQEWKKAYALYRATPKAVALTRLPFTVIRPLSMTYGYENSLYQW